MSSESPQRPQVDFSAAKLRLLRTARRIFWPHPALYYPFGILRKRGNVLDKSIEFYISGYPRSGNTFAREAFASVNPQVHFRSHRHIPTFILHSLSCGIPGIVLIRRPVDAALSWAIHEKQSLEQTIMYWIDYYTTLLPVRSDLFIVKFEAVTEDFGRVIKQFNARSGLAFSPFEHTPENAAKCFEATEEENRDPRGEIREMRVSRPSKLRKNVKKTFLQKLKGSELLTEEIARADELYDKFLLHALHEAKEKRTSVGFIIRPPEKKEGLK